MDSNNRNNRNGGNKKNNKNLRSVISLIGWALVLTLVFNYILAATSGGRSFEVPYSEMMQNLWGREDQYGSYRWQPSMVELQQDLGVGPQTQGL